MSLPLQVSAIKKQFRQGSSTIQALDGVDLEVQTGELVAIMGASGSGKSTLLHAIAGLTSLDGGTVTVDGQNLAELSDSKLTLFRRERIGLVFQAFNLVPVLSAEDNVRLPAGSGSEVNQRVDALFDRLGLSERRNHKPDALSGGEQQRVAIARAIITDPALLLADEPTGSLDSVTGQEICKLLRELCDEQNRTIVIVTHEPAVARWADRIVVLKDGRNLSSFDAKDINDPQSLASAYQDALQQQVLVGGEA